MKITRVKENKDVGSKPGKTSQGGKPNQSFFYSQIKVRYQKTQDQDKTPTFMMLSEALLQDIFPSTSPASSTITGPHNKSSTVNKFQHTNKRHASFKKGQTSASSFSS